MFLLAMIVVFLVLARSSRALFHPFVIMTTVPLAVIGALVGCGCTACPSRFSQIAAIMLVGLAAKNGILIVEFANQLRDALSSPRGRRRAAAIRLRPY